MNELKEMATEVVKKAWEQFGLPESKLPKIEWSRRLKTTAGLAIFKEGKHTIRLNEHLLERHGIDFVERTVYHEVAHSIQMVLFRGSRPHGREWKAIMRALGAKDISATHDYNVNGLVKRETVCCEKCGAELETGKVRYNRIKAGRLYRHTGCGGKIVIKD